MRRITYLTMLILMASTIVLTGCSQNDIYDYANTDQCMVMSVSVKSILDNAGIEMGDDGLRVPDELRNSAGRIAGFKGFSTERALVITGADASMDTWLMVLPLDNADEFAAELTAGGAKDEGKSDEYHVYADGGTTYMLTSTLALITNKYVKDGSKFAAKLKTLSAEKPLPSWIIKKLDDDKTIAGVVNIGRLVDSYTAVDPHSVLPAIYKKMYGADYAQCYSAFEIEFEGSKMKVDSKVYNTDGKEVGMAMKLPPVDTSLLRYASADDQVVMLTTAFKCDEFKSLAEDMISKYHVPDKKVISDILDAISGTVMLSGAVDDFKNLTLSSGWHLTWAITLKEDVADKAVKMISGMLDDDNKEKTEGDVVSFTSKDGDTIYLKQEGKVFIFSLNAPIKGDGKVDKSTFAGKTFVLKTNIAKQSPQTTGMSLPFGVRLKMEVDSQESEAEVKLDGDNGPFLKQLLEFAASF